MQRRVSQMFSVVVVLGCCAWFYAERSYEPAIVFIISLGAAIHQFWPQKDKQDFTALKREFFDINARWNVEKKLKPYSLDDAKWLLSEILDYLKRLRIEVFKSEFNSDIDRLFLEIKEAQSILIEIDGGVSYEKFWKNGSDSINQVAELIEKI